MHPVKHLLRVVELLVGIAALPEARRIADRETVARIDNDLRQLAVGIAGEKCLLEFRRGIGPRGEDGTSRGALGDGQQIRRQICFPTGEQPLLAGLAGAKAVVAVVFRHLRQSAAGSVPIGANAFQREAMALGGLPIDTAKADPLRGGARRGTEQSGERLQHLRINRKRLIQA